MPGRIATCSSAASAVFVRRGSTTTNRPPLARNALSRPGQSGAVARLPLDSNGLAPSIEQVVGAVDVGHGHRRSRGRTSAPAATSLGRWSTVLAENTLGVPSALMSGLAVAAGPTGCGRWGCRDRRRPRRARGGSTMAGSRRSTSANASSHVAGSSTPLRRTSGVRKPVGVVVELLERRALRADEPVAEDVGPIAPDPDRPPWSSDGDLEPAAGLAQRAGAVGGADLGPTASRRRAVGNGGHAGASSAWSAQRRDRWGRGNET